MLSKRFIKICMGFLLLIPAVLSWAETTGFSVAGKHRVHENWRALLQPCDAKTL